MKSIGGYFELELTKGTHYYHPGAYATKSGRASLLTILNFVKPSLVYIPYYTCDALLEPFIAAGINYTFYSINPDLEPGVHIDLQPGEYLLYINYFGLKKETVNRLSAQYKDKLIVDCTQAFFTKGNKTSWFFNSCRKFFGVPDGSYLYAPSGLELTIDDRQNETYIVDHLLQRFNGHSDQGYPSFLTNEKLAGGNAACMSKLSEYLLSQVDYTHVIKKRKDNYASLHKRLKQYNTLDMDQQNDDVPMCYPLLTSKKIDRAALFPRRIFIPTFWQDTITRGHEGFTFEKDLTERLLPLPIDHRYSEEDMHNMATAIIELISSSNG